jgi:hypothetical protein
VYLSIDATIRHSDRGSFVVGYTIDNAVEAEEKLKKLLSYLIHEHGESATYWFSTNAIGQAKGMKWDKENDRPITAEEMDLDLLLNDDADWTANMDAADITFIPIQVEVNLARPSLLHRVSNNALNGEVDSEQTFHQGVSNLPSNMDGDDSANRAAVIGDDSVSGGSGRVSGWGGVTAAEALITGPRRRALTTRGEIWHRKQRRLSTPTRRKCEMAADNIVAAVPSGWETTSNTCRN